MTVNGFSAMSLAAQQIGIARGKRNAGLLVACLLLLIGCRTAPDLRPFAEATSQLAGSIKSTGRMVHGEIDSMSAGWNEDQRKRAMELAEKFTREWTQQHALADALLEYSASLTAIAQAGEEGEKSARALADSFKQLCGSIEVAMPPAAAVDGAINIGAQLYGKFSRDYAARTLGEGMKQLQPSIDETTVMVGHSLRQIETGLDAIREQNDANFEDELLHGAKVRTHRNNLRVLSERQTALLEMLALETQTRDALRRELIAAANEAKEKDLARLSKLGSDITTELAAVEASLRSEGEAVAPVDVRKAAVRERLSTEITLVRTIRAGLGDWAAAHARLAAAALERKPLQVEDLVQTALEIRELVSTIRASRQE
jgi:hypothetical protein